MPTYLVPVARHLQGRWFWGLAPRWHPMSLVPPPPGAARALREARLGALTPAHAAKQPCSAPKPAPGLQGGTRAGAGAVERRELAGSSQGARRAVLELRSTLTPHACASCLNPPLRKGRWQHSHGSAAGRVTNPRAAPWLRAPR